MSEQHTDYPDDILAAGPLVDMLERFISDHELAGHSSLSMTTLYAQASKAVECDNDTGKSTVQLQIVLPPGATWTARRSRSGWTRPS